MLKISRFSDDAGRPLTLAQLAEREAASLLKLSDAELRSMARWIGEQRVDWLLRRKKAS